MDDSLTTADGLELQLRDWPCERPHGSVLIVHGLGEHIGRYLHVAQHLNDWGWNVIGYDQRGHGASEGPRGRLAAADDLLLDLSRVIDAVRAAHDGPLVLLGHSLGGLVAARFVAEGALPAADPAERPASANDGAGWACDRRCGTARSMRWCCRRRLSTPACARLQKVLLAVLGPLTPNLAVANGLKAEWISRAPAVVTAYNRDPLVHDRIAPRLARFLVDSGPFVLQRAPSWTVPTLLMYAGSDRCVAPAGSAAFAAAAPKSVVSVRRFQPLFHEIFNEPEQVEVFSALRGWLTAQARHL